jgi:hypothetical protein
MGFSLTMVRQHLLYQITKDMPSAPILLPFSPPPFFIGKTTPRRLRPSAGQSGVPLPPVGQRASQKNASLAKEHIQTMFAKETISMTIRLQELQNWWGIEKGLINLLSKPSQQLHRFLYFIRQRNFLKAFNGSILGKCGLCQPTGFSIEAR